MHITKRKKSIWNGYILYDSNFMTFWQRYNYECSKGLMVAKCWRGVRDKEGEHRGLLGQGKYSAWH